VSLNGPRGPLTRRDSLPLVLPLPHPVGTQAPPDSARTPWREEWVQRRRRRGGVGVGGGYEDVGRGHAEVNE